MGVGGGGGREMSNWVLRDWAGKSEEKMNKYILPNKCIKIVRWKKRDRSGVPGVQTR